MQLHEAAKLRDWESVQKMFLEAAKELASELKIPRGQSVFHTGGLKESHGIRWPCVAN